MSIGAARALGKAREAILYLCRRCDEQGFYSPPRQKLVLDALELIEAETALQIKEFQEKCEHDYKETFSCSTWRRYTCQKCAHEFNQDRD